jgi:nitrite reductase/ring-hydroxylating ferredoxin subunit
MPVLAASNMKDRNLPSPRMPSGWFQIGWSQDFGERVATRVSYFDREFVVYRGESGELHALDGYCRHFGAHLGVGGTVEGEGVRCPFHGWMYGPDGANTDIPYSHPDMMNNLRLGCWEVREIDEVVIMYHGAAADAGAGQPTAFRPSHLDTWPVWEVSTRIWRDMPAAPQMAAENVVDAAHFKFVHRNETIGELAVLDHEGPVFRTRVEAKQGDGGTKPTWATPHGPVDARVDLEARGLGLLWNVQYGFDEITSLLGVTPTSPETMDVRATIWVPHRRGDGTSMPEEIRDRWIAFMHRQIESDLEIWNHQTYVPSAPLAQSEQDPMRKFRRWSRQFYAAP